MSRGPHHRRSQTSFFTTSEALHGRGPEDIPVVEGGAFTIYPYQLGDDGNQKGLASGAWWFYQKLGFRARDPQVLQLWSAPRVARVII